MRGRRGFTRLARARHRRILRLAGAVVALSVVGTGMAVGVHTTSDRLAAFAQTAPTDQADPIRIEAAHDASFVPVAAGARPLFILALGSDARPGQRVSTQRADSIHIIGVDRARRNASILGIPRDSWVTIPGYGSARINKAMTIGGPQLVVATVEKLTGITIDYWMLTSFTGLQRMVDAIGGLTLSVPYPMDDGYSHAHLRAGRQELKGWQVLAFSRNRKDTPNGDFSRSLNQGRVFLAALAQLRTEFRESPGRLLTWIVGGWRNLQTDLGFETLLDLAMVATQIPVTSVNNVVLPGSSGRVGLAAVVFLSPAVSGIFADMRADGLIR